MKRTLIVACLLAALSAALMAGEKNAGSEPAAVVKPKLDLTVSTFNGYIPLSLKLSGTISGIDLAQVEACQISVEWQGEKTPGILRNSKDYLSCVDKEAALTSNVSKELLLGEPGVYSYRLVVTPKGGKPVASASREVKVVRSPVEMKVTGTTN